MARHDRAVPAPGIEGADLLFALEAVVADGIMPIRHIEPVRLFAAVFVHLGPIIRDQPVERIPQRQIIAVLHGLRTPPAPPLRAAAAYLSSHTVARSWLMKWL